MPFKNALSSEQCQIEDVATNLALLKAILKDPAFRAREQIQPI